MLGGENNVNFPDEKGLPVDLLGGSTTSVRRYPGIQEASLKQAEIQDPTMPAMLQWLCQHLLKTCLIWLLCKG